MLRVGKMEELEKVESGLLRAIAKLYIHPRARSNFLHHERVSFPQSCEKKICRDSNFRYPLHIPLGIYMW